MTIPDYKNIKIENVMDLTNGDVLIVGYDEAHSAWGLRMETSM
jgi:hypothetical protein